MANAILENGEALVGLSEVAAKNAVHYTTMTRWIELGCKARTGTRVYLVGVRRGSKWFTSAEAVIRFFDELTRQSVPNAPAVVSAKEISLKNAATMRALDELLA